MVAIGMAPVGVLAVGIVATGVVAVSSGISRGIIAISCGVAVGLVSIFCGVGFGYRVRGVGVGAGVDAAVLGSFFSLRPNPFPRKPRPPEFTPIASLVAGAADVGVIEVQVNGGQIVHEGNALDAEIEPTARLSALEGERAYAAVRSETLRESTSYREMSSSRTLVVESLTPIATRSASALARWSGGVVLRVLFVAATIGASFIDATLEPSPTEPGSYSLRDVHVGAPWR